MIGIGVVSGCASNASVDNMVVTQPINKPLTSKILRENIQVDQVTGGHETNPLWTSKINDTGFKEALIESLEIAALYGEKNSRYQLSAKMLALQQPVVGFNLTVTCMVQYRLVDMKTGSLLYHRTVKTPYTAKFTDDLYACSRLQEANEGAAKRNIAELIKDLYQLNLKNDIHVS